MTVCECICCSLFNRSIKLIEAHISGWLPFQRLPPPSAAFRCYRITFREYLRTKAHPKNGAKLMEVNVIGFLLDL